MAKYAASKSKSPRPSSRPSAPALPKITVPNDGQGHDSAEDSGSGGPSVQREGVRNLKDPRVVTKLRECMEASAKALAPFRRRHKEAVQLAAGSRYGDGSAVGQTPLRKTSLNIFRLALEVLARNLISATPRTQVIPRVPKYKVEAYELQLAVDYLTQQITLGDTLAEAVRIALTSMGVVKVGITDAYMHESLGFKADAGQPFASPVLFEDFLFDTNASHWDEVDWVGNKYRVPLESVMDNPSFDKKVADKMRSRAKETLDFDDLMHRTQEISGQPFADQPEFIEHVWLWDIHIPYDNRIVTLPAQDGLGVLQQREWTGPESGPYHRLGFFWVAGNLMPSAPMQHLYDIQSLLTSLFSEMGEQATRQKTITLCDGRAEADGTAEAIVDSSSGDVIRTNTADGVKVVSFPGVEDSTLRFSQLLREWMSYMGGNIDTIGGLAAQTQSVGQERLLAGSSSDLIRHMQAQVTTFTANILKDLAYYVYTDPISELELTKPIPGYQDIPFAYGPESRQGSFFNFQFTVQPYTLQARGPTERLQMLYQIVTQMLMPLAPQFGEWGTKLRVDRLVEYILRDANFPELLDIVEQAPVKMAGAGQNGQGGPQAAIEKRRPLQSPVTIRQTTRTPEGQQPTLKEKEAGLSGAGRGVKAVTPGVQPVG